jgi:hypothetical protein
MLNGNSNMSWNGSSNMGMNSDGVIAKWFCPVIVWHTRPGKR